MNTVTTFFIILFIVTAVIAWRLWATRAELIITSDAAWDRVQDFKEQLQEEREERAESNARFIKINTQNAETIAKREEQYRNARDLAVALAKKFEDVDMRLQKEADAGFQFGAMIAGAMPDAMERFPWSEFDEGTVGASVWRGFDYGMTPHPEFRGDPEEIAGPDPQFGRLKVGTRVGRSDGVVWERDKGADRNRAWFRVDLGLGEIRESHTGMRKHGYKVLEPETAPEETEEA